MKAKLHARGQRGDEANLLKVVQEARGVAKRAGRQMGEKNNAGLTNKKQKHSEEGLRRS